MELIMAYRGRNVTVEDVAFIRSLILDNADSSRRSLSKKLCVAWDWRQPNGHLWIRPGIAAPAIVLRTGSTSARRPGAGTMIRPTAPTAR